jgi:hypothetical protein
LIAAVADAVDAAFFSDAVAALCVWQPLSVAASASAATVVPPHTGINRFTTLQPPRAPYCRASVSPKAREARHFSRDSPRHLGSPRRSDE